MDNRPYGNASLEYQDEWGESHTGVSIDELGLTKGQKFTLHYDYGDDWLFVINTQTVEKLLSDESPLLLRPKGEIEQYPDYDEWDEE